MQFKKYINAKSQFLIVLAGFVFAVSMVVIDFQKFYVVEGTYFRFRDTFILHPFFTPCFWGTVWFLVCVALAGLIFFKARKQLQKTLTTLLLMGTLFAWGNFGYTLWSFYDHALTSNNIVNTSETVSTPGGYSCSGANVSNPLLTPCFGGTVFYTASYLAALYLIKSRLSSDTD